LRWACFSTAVSLLFVLAPPAFAQQADGGHRGYPPITKFTNLQVFPKDIPPPDLIKQMRQFSADLGVHCGFCHEGNEEARQMNFPADGKPEKKTARVMIAMTAEINAKYLAMLPAGDAKASCYTCHRGHSKPEAQPPAPAPGAAPAAPAQ
jgi:thioredoxin reductase